MMGAPAPFWLPAGLSAFSAEQAVPGTEGVVPSLVDGCDGWSRRPMI